MIKKLINWSILTLFTLGVLLAIVAIVELYCAYSYYKYRDTLKNEINAIRLREPFLNHRSLDYNTDSSGYILPYTPISETSNTVVFMGGSTTMCEKVSSDKRIHVNVENVLQNTSCLNIGVSGSNSMHTLDLLANKVMSLKPDVVVLNHNVNDLSVLLNTGTYFNNHPQRSLIVSNTEHLSAYKVGYPKNWFVRNFIPHISLVLLPTTFEGEKWPEHREFSSEPLEANMNVDVLKNTYKKSMLGLVNYAKSWGVKPVLMTQGSCFKHFGIENIDRYEGYNLDSLHNVFNEVVREVANETSISLVDAEKLMEDKKELFYDSVHYTDSGSVYISEHISKAVKKLVN